MIKDNFHWFLMIVQRHYAPTVRYVPLDVNIHEPCKTVIILVCQIQPIYPWLVFSFFTEVRWALCPCWKLPSDFCAGLWVKRHNLDPYYQKVSQIPRRIETFFVSKLLHSLQTQNRCLVKHYWISQAWTTVYSKMTFKSYSEIEFLSKLFSWVLNLLCNIPRPKFYMQIQINLSLSFIACSYFCIYYTGSSQTLSPFMR